MPEPAALPSERSLWPVLMGGLLLLAAAMLFGLSWGSTDVNLLDALRGSDGTEWRILRYRLDHVLLAAVVGAALALAGMLFQALLRNPLASPFTLGVAGGGSLGAFIIISLESTALGTSLTAALAPWGIAGARAAGAFAGVLLTVGLVFALARAAGGVETVTLLLAGVTLNFICSAGVILIQALADSSQTMRMVRWSMGGFHPTGGQLPATLVLMGVGLAIILPTLRHLDVLSLDDRTAHLLGVPVRRTRAQIILGTAIMVGACLAVAGPIGFIGLIVPHTCRLLVGPDHRRLVPATALGGASLLLVADTLARGLPAHLLGRTGELPVGVLTAALGGPFFLSLLLKMNR
ncbi:iron ABC transporter permease [Candidatus Sumerlaeota bacterium]|nr:iron ABC transporter permease [Candidatus Sumerlaeota bacterium]